MGVSVFCCIISFLYIKPQPRFCQSMRGYCCIISFLYIKPQLITSLYVWARGCIISFLYIKPQQGWRTSAGNACCIISFLYIKPQLQQLRLTLGAVVLYRFSTSNHNYGIDGLDVLQLYYIVSLHQTTTCTTYIISNQSFDYFIGQHEVA